MFYRLHYDKVDEQTFIEEAATWYWDDLGNGLEEVTVEGYYSAVKNPADMFRYIDDMRAQDDDWVAVFEGEKINDPRVEEAHLGEVWVRPTRIIEWVTVGEFKKRYGR